MLVEKQQNKTLRSTFQDQNGTEGPGGGGRGVKNEFNGLFRCSPEHVFTSGDMVFRSFMAATVDTRRPFCLFLKYRGHNFLLAACSIPGRVNQVENYIIRVQFVILAKNNKKSTRT